MTLGDVIQNITIFAPGTTWAVYSMGAAPALMLFEGFLRIRARIPPHPLVSPRYIWKDAVSLRVTKKFLKPVEMPSKPVNTRLPTDLADIRSDAQLLYSMSRVITAMKA
eukprot:RCo043858